MNPEFSLYRKQILNLSFYAWIVAAEIIKIGYITTCDCFASNVPFWQWFFPSYQQTPYTFWWTYHGLRFLGGPYSLLWWFLNLPAIHGFYWYFAYLLTMDLVVFYFLQWKSRGYAIYWLTLSTWFVTYDPVDFFIIAFTVLGRYRLAWLILAPLTKLPIGSELVLGNFSVWQWVFTSQNSFSGPENYGRYLILASVWILSLGLYLWKLNERKAKDSSRDTGLPDSGMGSRLSARRIRRTDGPVETG